MLRVWLQYVKDISKEIEEYKKSQEDDPIKVTSDPIKSFSDPINVAIATAITCAEFRRR